MAAQNGQGYSMKSSQFACQCGCGLSYEDMDNALLSLLTLAERLAEQTFHINSGIRCVSHNASVGGSKTSSHLLGMASDIATPNSRIRYKVLNGLLAAGIKRIGIYKTFIHADHDYNKPMNLIWRG